MSQGCQQDLNCSDSQPGIRSEIFLLGHFFQENSAAVKENGRYSGSRICSHPRGSK